MSRYHRGREFEWKVRDELIKHGYKVVRAAGSKGDCGDLVAIKCWTGIPEPGQHLLLFVQCKRGHCPVAEREALEDSAAQVGAIPLLATYVPRKPIKWQLIDCGLRDWEWK